MTFAFEPKKRKPVRVDLSTAAKPKDKKLSRFEKKHSKHKMDRISLAAGKKTMRKCRDCGCVHFEKHG